MNLIKRHIMSNFLVLILLNIGNVLAYLFQLVIAHYMTPADYGAFNSLNSLIMVLAAAASAVPLVMARFVVPAAAQSKEYVRGVLSAGLRIMGAIALILVICGAIAIPFFSSYLHIDDYVTLIMVFFICGATLLYFVPIGTLQGLGRYIAMSTALNSVSGGRLLGAVVLVAGMGMGVRGAVLSCLLSSLLALALGLASLRDIYRYQAAKIAPEISAEAWRCAVPVLVGTTLIVFLGNVDVIFVRHYCSPETSGLYATAAVIARIANLFPGVLISLLFPEVVRAENSGHGSKYILLVNLCLTIFIGGTIALIFSMWPDYIIVFLMGRSYSGSGSYLGIIAMAMAVLAVCNTIFTYWLGRGEYKSLWLLACGSIIFVSLVVIYHDSPQTIIRLLLVSLTSVSVAALVQLGWMSRKRACMMKKI